MLSKEITKKSFWALKVSEVLDLLETTNEGISEAEVVERRKIFGKNKIPEQDKTAKLKIFLNQFANPLIFLLLIAASITALVKDYTNAAAIFAAAILNSLLGFYQEDKAEEAISQLKSYIEKRVRIIRDGKESEIDTEKLVPGDIIRISQGDRIPADARLIYINDFLVDETILTGESLPVPKNTETVPFHVPIGDQKSMIFSGTLAAQGFANAVVCRIGTDTEIGRIASLVKDQIREKTPLQKAIAKFSIISGLSLLALTVAVFLIGVLLGYHSILEMFLISVAILVSAVPEGLPVALTVILAIGVQRLAKKNGVIRKLLAAETLGNTTVILTDKTGTITEAKMELSKISLFNSEKNSYIDEELLIKLALVNTDVIIENPQEPPEKWHLIGRPIETAVVKSAAKLKILPSTVKKEMKSLNYLPFNSSNKYSASLIEYQSKILLAVLGAPEIILRLSHQTPDEQRKLITASIDKMAYAGERVIGMAIRDVTEEMKKNEIHLSAKQKFENLSFLGTISLIDPIRSGVRDAIHRVEQVGIKTVIVTGDHRGTAEAVAKELGFQIKNENVINGADLDMMTDENLKSRLPNLKIVSRVSPEGKVKIVKAYQNIGETVAMTGDGINDAPGLKQADIGIAMGSGTDVAKEVAELILLDDNYNTIISAVSEGRRTMENVRKVIVYLLSSVFDELILIGGSLLLGINLPLNAIQILWVNFFTDSLPAVALAFEDGVDYLLQKPKKMSGGLIDSQMRFLIGSIGIPSSALLFMIYITLLHFGFNPELTRTFIFAAFGTYSLFLVFAVRSLKKSIFSYNPISNPYLLFGAGLGLILMLGAIYLPQLQNILKTTALPASWLMGVILIGILNIAAIEFGKWIYRNN